MRILCLVAAIACAQPASAQIRSVTLQRRSRDFGYFAGDVLSSTALIAVGPDTVLDVATLPAAGPVAAAIDVRRVETTREKLADGTLVRIRVTYQNFVAPEQVTTVDVPGYTLAFSHGGVRLTASIPGFDFTASPFRHDLAPVLDVSALRPDHAPDSIDPANPLRALYAGSAIAAVAVLILLRPARRTGPFADAARQIRGAAGDTARDAVLALHRAFDATAGRPVLADDTDIFFEQHPRFAALRSDIEKFFAASRAVFFANGTEPPDMSVLRRLSRRLMRAERT